ncbi:hypothetical protein BS47DRAFT_152648 [Hydnum rufescens UP504]|uniref:Uncharacterized protein n=1 Tax=Hydnum rufescens UP504 TaxID=1448309 RepID=A0A9P6APR9_9AGAM|nr:hypothetical protein BS47DRAFT_152648 [Hydnum rufescens UP504]
MAGMKQEKEAKRILQLGGCKKDGLVIACVSMHVRSGGHFWSVGSGRERGVFDVSSGVMRRVLGGRIEVPERVSKGSVKSGPGRSGMVTGILDTGLIRDCLGKNG